MPLRIAVVQFEIRHLDRKLNFRRIEDFVRQAVAGGANVVVFPEDCTTGSIFGVLSRLDSSGETRKTFQNIAKKYRIDLVTGSVMEGTSKGNFNTSYYIDATGNVLAQYRKNHLYPSEYRFLQPGTEAKVVETAYGKIGIVICWDLLFSEIFSCLKQQGVQIVYCPSYWYQEIAGPIAALNPHSEEDQVDALCLARAVETNCAFVYANAAGIQTYADGTTDTLIGHSQICLPGVGVLQRFAHREEGLFFQDVDLSVLAQTAFLYRDSA